MSWHDEFSKIFESKNETSLHEELGYNSREEMDSEQEAKHNASNDAQLRGGY